MALGNNGVVILSKVKSVYVGNIYSVVSSDELQNGFIGHLGDYKTGEREIRNLVKPTTASIKTNGVVLVASSEINYDESYSTSKALQNFKIDANVPARAYEIVEHDEFEVSKNLVTPLNAGTGVVVGNYVTATNASYGFTEVATLPLATDASFVAKIVDKRTLGTVTNVGGAGNITGAVDLIALEVIRNVQ